MSDKTKIELWECPDCGFGFDAKHAFEDGSYACPVCAETKLADLAIAVRDAQKRYFRDRTRENLVASKQAEKALDDALDGYRSSPA